MVVTDELPELLIAGAAAFLAMLLIALAYPAGMGMGDVKLAGVMGLYLGAAVIPALLSAFLAGTVVGLGVMVRQGPGARKKGAAVRAVPGAGRRRRAAGGPGAGRSLPRQFPALAQGFSRPADTDENLL